MQCVLNLSATTILSRSPRYCILHHYSLIKILQDTPINRNNNQVYREKTNYLPRTGLSSPQRYKTALLIELYFILFLDELRETTHHVFMEGCNRINRVLTLGAIAESLDKDVTIVSKKHFAKELRNWFLSCLTREDHNRVIVYIKSSK